MNVTHEYFNNVDLTTEEGRIKHIKGLMIEADHYLSKWYKFQNRNALSTLGSYIKCIKYLMKNTTLEDRFKERIESELFTPFEANKYKIYE